MESPGLERLKADPTPWLLEPETPAVRHTTLRLLLDRPEDDPEVREALAAAMRTDPIAALLAAQPPHGDRRAAGVSRPHPETEAAGFPSSSAKTDRPPPPSTVVHCLHGNLLRALIGFGWLDDPRVKRALDWHAPLHAA